jgi:hypothetical protein
MLRHKIFCLTIAISVLGLHAAQPVHNEQQHAAQHAAIQAATDAVSKLEKDLGYASSHYKIGAFLDEHALLIGILLAAISGCGYGTKLHYQRVQEFREWKAPHCGTCVGCQKNSTEKTDLYLCVLDNPYYNMNRDLACIEKVLYLFVLTMITSDISAHVVGKKLKAMAEHKPYTLLQNLRRTLIEALLHHPYLIGGVLEILAIIAFKGALKKTRSTLGSLAVSVVACICMFPIGFSALICNDFKSGIEKWLDSKERYENDPAHNKNPRNSR